MITLITGGPGLGKTALALDLILKEYPDRTLFSNVKGLTIEHGQLPNVADWTRQTTNAQGVEDFEFTFPAGSIIVIDECQRFFPPRATGSKVPATLRAFETHRHTGVDFILITQGTRLLDVHLRSLVKGGRHIFLHQAFFNRYRFERNECIEEDDRSSRALAAKRKYKLPKHVFSLYKSSELHTKPARSKLPIQAYVLGVAFILAVGLGYRIYSRANEKFGTKDLVSQVGGEGVAKPRTEPQLANINNAANFIEGITPVDVHNPLSAPIYAAVLPVVVAPEIKGCISSKKSCSCYSQQSTPIWLPDEQCRERAAGRFYDPYQNPALASHSDVKSQPTDKQQTRPAPEAVPELI